MCQKRNLRIYPGLLAIQKHVDVIHAILIRIELTHVWLLEKLGSLVCQTV